MTRLTAERQSEIFTGTLELVSRHGFEAVSMDGIAEHTHSSKATLYRQWGSKAGLVIEALAAKAPQAAGNPDTGSLRGDLLALVTRETHKKDHGGRLIAAIVHAALVDPDLASALRARILRDRELAFDVILDRAVARGEVAADAPGRRYVTFLLVAPAVLGVLLDDKPFDVEALTDYFDAVVLPVLGVDPHLNREN